MTARTAVALAAAALVIATAVTEIITGAGVTARIVTIGVLAGIAGGGFVLRLIGPSKGEHAVPRRYGGDELTALPHERTIPRARTEHEPPWQPAPAFQAAPVIEPAAVTHGPPDPEPEAYWIAAGTVTDDGQVRLEHVAVLPPPVQKELRHATVDEALESMFTRAMALRVRALTDGTS